MRLSILWSSVLLLAAGSLSGQTSPPPRPVLVVADSGTTQRLVLKDGSELMGRITSVGDSTVQFQGNLGLITIRSDQILRVHSERGGMVKLGQYYFPNPNSTRLIFAPTGRMLDRGEGYFSDYWVFFPGISFAVTDMFSMGGGMSIFPGVGLGEQLLYVTPKLGIVQREKYNAAVGVLYAAIPGFD